MKNFCDDKDYFISKDGEVFSKKSGTMKKLKTRINDKGYEDIKIKGKTYKIHRLVAEAYIPNPLNKPQVNHKNGVKSKNYVTNLEWVDNSENQKHAWDTGLQKKRNASNRIFNDDEIALIVEDYTNNNLSQRDLASKYGVAKTTIADILRGKYYNANKQRSNVNREKNVRKLTYEQANEIRERYSNEKVSLRQLGRDYGVDHSVISAIIKNKTYV